MAIECSPTVMLFLGLGRHCVAVSKPAVAAAAAVAVPQQQPAHNTASISSNSLTCLAFLLLLNCHYSHMPSVCSLGLTMCKVRHLR
jgi:hypothetical protein